MLLQCFAQFTPIPADFQLGVISLIFATGALVGILAYFRRRPPVGENLVQLRGSLDALNTSVGVLTEAHNALTEAHNAHISHAAEIEALQEKVRTLERLREEDQKANRTYTRESTERIFKRIDELGDSMNKNFHSVERSLGQLEGQVAAARAR